MLSRASGQFSFDGGWFIAAATLSKQAFQLLVRQFANETAADRPLRPVHMRRMNDTRQDNLSRRRGSGRQFDVKQPAGSAKELADHVNAAPGDVGDPGGRLVAVLAAGGTDIGFAG
jgi:hypothetical protein